MKQHIKHSAKIISIIIISIFGACNDISQTNKQKDTNKNFRILRYGEQLNMEIQNAESVVAAKWGIEYFNLGCIVTDELIDSVNRNNKVIEYLLQKKHGKTWQISFKKEIEDELNKQRAVSSLLDNDEHIISKRNELEKEGNGLHYRFHPINKSEYNVNAMGWNQINGREVLVSYFRYFVNIDSRIVKLTSDSIVIE